MKKVSDFSPYTNILPYASEIFGVYQPMLGWSSKRIRGRVEKGFANDVSRLFDSLYGKFKGQFAFELNEDRSLKQIRRVDPASADTPQSRLTGSFIIDGIARKLPPLAKYDDAIWNQLIRADRLKETLTKQVLPKTLEWYKNASEQERRTGRRQDDLNNLVADQLNRESAVAGYLLYLKANKHLDQLKQFFYKADLQIAQIGKLLSYQDPLDVLDPHKDIDRAGLSPIGIVHLFRQYFFEFDTFLGPPVSHVWLSPGAIVELVEISARKTIVERTFESSLETALKTEKSTTEEDEISDAVKEDNKSDTKFGVNATANQSWVGGSASASASIDMATTQSKAREVTHRHMRQQTEKLSTEIRKNYKSTFRTITEVTDTSSKRYVLSNTTQNLINYELRRKMRQVGVQIQDIGTYLCWQTYVDDPGRQLGISKLVHIAKGPEVGTAPPPEGIPMPQDPLVTQIDIDIPFVQTSEGEGDRDEGYKHGREADEDFNEGAVETIQADFGGNVAACDQPGYEYGNRVEFDYGGNDVVIKLMDVVEDPKGRIQFGIHLDYVNFRGNSPIRVAAKVTWRPLGSVIDEINAKNKEKVGEFNEKTKYEHQKAFVEAARERIKLASNIEPRKFEDLREEERIVVYRSLIQDMLTKDIPVPDDRTRHVVAELLNTIFDVDKMLYFVAPEWWRPRLHQSHQGLGGIRETAGGGEARVAAGGGVANTVYGKLQAEATKYLVAGVSKAVEDTQIAPVDTVTWGGTHENRVDNYYITEESVPAKLGSSLGWLLQLDGDNLRNAFLNAPWVKAVIPIRPGKERAAINWLQRVHVEGTDGLDDLYVARPANWRRSRTPARSSPFAMPSITSATSWPKSMRTPWAWAATPATKSTTTIGSLPPRSTRSMNTGFTPCKADSGSCRAPRTSRSSISGWKCCPPTRLFPSRSPTIRRRDGNCEAARRRRPPEREYQTDPTGRRRGVPSDVTGGQGNPWPIRRDQAACSHRPRGAPRQPGRSHPTPPRCRRRSRIGARGSTSSRKHRSARVTRRRSSFPACSKTWLSSELGPRISVQRSRSIVPAAC